MNYEVVILSFIISGECIMEASNDGCGLHAIPLRCDEQNTCESFFLVCIIVQRACLCNAGYRPGDGSCLGKCNQAIFLIITDPAAIILLL